MDIQPIRTDEDQPLGTREIKACWGALESTEEGDGLEVLTKSARAA